VIPLVVAGATGARRGRLVIGEVDQLVLAELRVQGEVHETGEALRVHLRHAGHWIRIEDAVANHAQPPRPLANQDAAIGKKRHAPRLHEPLRHDQANLMLDARIEHHRPIRQRRRRPNNRRRRVRNSHRTLRPGRLLLG